MDNGHHPQREGYWLVAEDRGTFTFGNAAFKGSVGAMNVTGTGTALAAAGHPTTFEVVRTG